MSQWDRSSSSNQNTNSSSNITGTSCSSSPTALGEHDTVDSAPSPIDIECHIQTERITKILDKLVYKTKLAICFPTLLLENVLVDILSNKHLTEVDFIIEKYEIPVNDINVTNMNALADLQAGDMSMKNRVNSELSNLMHILCSYPELKPHVDRITAQGKETSGLKHLLKVEEFRDLMVTRMGTMAAEEFGAIVNTRKLEKSNSECLEKITEYTRCLKEEKRDSDEQMRQKVELIAQLKQEIKLIERKASDKRKKKILDSEKQMVLATRSHKVRIQMLKEEEVESKEDCDNAVTHDMLAEKQLRDRRRKVETQLQSWLQKYDTDMQTKQDELDKMTKDYDEEVKKCEELKLKLAEQDKEFYPLMKEKDEEYDEEMTAKLNAFIIEHAARVIQYAWRTTLQNRVEKKKLQKLKKKMEAEREAAAIRAEIEAKKQELLAKKQAAIEKANAKSAAKAMKLEAKANKEKEGRD